MANECSNYITIQGNPLLIETIALDYIGQDKEQGEVYFNFGLLCPIPKDIEEDYWWRIEHWGNKWDGSDAYIDICDDEITINVETAWGPCDKWTYKLIEMCPGVNIYHEFYEPGEGFIGWINHCENEGPYEYEETDFNQSEPMSYWLATFEKEYETFDWLCDHIDNLLDDEEITKEIHDELLKMIDDDDPLEVIIARCIETKVL